jgi:hypothetical protein
VTAEPANAAELHAAEHECAESAVALAEAVEALRLARTNYLAALREVGDGELVDGRGVLTARDNQTAQHLRHRNAVTAYAAIRPKGTP